jgi:hypothetical protein
MAGLFPFTTSHFAECAQRIGALVENPAVEASAKIALRAIEIANLLALNNSPQVPDKLQALIDSLTAQADDFKVTWTFNGTKHFILPFRTLICEIAGILISAKSDSYAISALMSVVLLFLL